LVAAKEETDGKGITVFQDMAGIHLSESSFRPLKN